MNRRTVLATAGLGALTALAGCGGSRPGEVSWEWEAEKLVGQGFVPKLFVLGEVIHEQGRTVDGVRLNMEALTDGGEAILQDSKDVRGIVSGTRQEFYFRHEISQDQAKQIDDIDITGKYI